LNRAETNRRLRELGWRVVRVWEHEPPESAAPIVEAEIREGMSLLGVGLLDTAQPPE
jgi:G:T-mismatch repair DNA endonuclease (very short patch repair protein)